MKTASDIWQAVEASLRQLRELLDDVLRTQREYDPTKPVLDAAGNVIIKGQGEGAEEEGDGMLAVPAWKELPHDLTREEMAAMVGQQEVDRIFGVDGAADIPPGPSKTAEELAAMVERNMAGAEADETSTKEKASSLELVGGNLPDGGDGDGDGERPGRSTGDGTGDGDGGADGRGPENIATEADRKLAENTADVARWRAHIPEEEREQYDSVTAQLLGYQKLVSGFTKAGLALMRK